MSDICTDPNGTKGIRTNNNLLARNTGTYMEYILYTKLCLNVGILTPSMREKYLLRNDWKGKS